MAVTENTVEVHADELTYSPTGLSTPTAFHLQVGRHHKVVIKRPLRVKAVPAGLGGFAFDSSFPTPAALGALLAPSYQQFFDDLFGTTTSVYYQLFGHAQPEGKEARNKELSERRASALCAVLVGDPDELRKIAEVDSWAAREAQVMLRVLRCDPGMIDGTPGEVTTAAVQVFQEEYRDGVFHRHIEEVDPALPTLKVDGILGTQTRSALIEAYALACSPRVPPEQLHPSHPIVGCTEFNQLEDPETPPHMNRRVTLVTHDALPPFHDNAPCTMGDHNACPVTDTGPLRCPWYRLHVEDADPNEVGQLHFDLRWLQLPNGKILLSALTTLDDDTPVSRRTVRFASLRLGGRDLQPSPDRRRTKPGRPSGRHRSRPQRRPSRELRASSRTRRLRQWRRRNHELGRHLGHLVRARTRKCRHAAVCALRCPATHDRRVSSAADATHPRGPVRTSDLLQRFWPSLLSLRRARRSSSTRGARPHREQGPRLTRYRETLTRGLRSANHPGRCSPSGVCHSSSRR